MKKLSAFLLCMILLFSAACADPVPSKLPVTIDGVRVAFFSASGEYLPPLEEEGTVWVPAVSLGESLGMSITADPDTGAVSKDGIRVAVFDAEGNYLAPRTIDGTVYVPLTAFAESIGLQYDSSEGGIALARPGTVQAAAVAAAPTAEPEPAATATPMYADIPLTLDNYRNYFMLSHDYYEHDVQEGDYYIVYTARIQATTSYGIKNVYFKRKDYGTVQIPATGQATSSYRTDSIHFSKDVFSKEKIYQKMNMGIDAALKVATSPEVISVGGSVLLPWSEAEALWEKAYASAVGRFDLVSKSSAYDNIISTLEDLVKVGYKDSAEQLKIAREKKAELIAKEEKAAKVAEEQKKAESYRAAEDALAEGRYQEAADAFAALGGYSDSKQRETEARNAGYEAEYLEAETLISQGDYDAAITLWTGLTEKEYRDSAERLSEAKEQKNAALYQAAVEMRENHQYEEAISQFKELADISYSDSSEQITVTENAREQYREDLYEADYQAALEMEKNCRFTEARAAFEPLAEAEYKDSKTRLEKNGQAESWLDERINTYRKGVEAEEAGNWSEALDAFLTCLDYSNAQAHAAACMLNSGDAWVLPPSEGRYFFVRGEISGYADTNTGIFRIFPDCAVDRDANTVTNVYYYKRDFWKSGLCVIRADDRIGLMNAAGEMVVPVEAVEIDLQGQYIFSFVTKKDAKMYDIHGNTAREGLYLRSKATSYLAQYTREDGQKEKLLFISDGSFVESGYRESAVLSNDGKVYRVRTEGNRETLYSEDGTEVFSADQIYHDLEHITADERWHMYNGVIAFKQKGNWGLYDISKGKQLMKPSMGRIFPFTVDGVARFANKNKFGIVSAAGRQVVGAKYESIGPFRDGMAKASKYTKKKINNVQQKVSLYGFVNSQGKEVIKLKYLKTGDFSSGYGVTWAAADDGVMPRNKKQTRYSYFILNKNGNELVSVKKDNNKLNAEKLGILLPDIFMLQTNVTSGQVGLFNREGNTVARGTTAKRINDELVLLTMHANGSRTRDYKVIDNEGRVLYETKQQKTELTFNAVSLADLHMVYVSNGTGILADKQGKRWYAAAPAAQPEPEEADLNSAAAYAGITE